jgi:hypothetical protein
MGAVSVAKDVPASVKALASRMTRMLGEIEASLTGADKPGSIPEDQTFLEWLLLNLVRRLLQEVARHS